MPLSRAWFRVMSWTTSWSKNFPRPFISFFMMLVNICRSIGSTIKASKQTSICRYSQPAICSTPTCVQATHTTSWRLPIKQTMVLTRWKHCRDSDRFGVATAIWRHQPFLHVPRVPSNFPTRKHKKTRPTPRTNLALA